jgi:phage terminase small subunit
VIANQLLAKTLLRDEIARLKEERNQRLKVDADWILQRLREEAEADLADILNDDGTVKPLEDWPPIWRTGLITGIEIREIWGRDKDGNRRQVGVTKKLKLSEKIKRVELIGRHTDVQAFKERVGAAAGDPLKKLFEQISGQAIRPRLEDEDADDSEAEPVSGDRTKH